jgi:hypothetical protein
MTTDALATFRKILGQLTEVSAGLKSLDQDGRLSGEGHEASKAVAWTVAAVATEVARDAVRLCNRFDPDGGPRRTGRRWWFMKRRLI